MELSGVLVIAGTAPSAFMAAPASCMFVCSATAGGFFSPGSSSELSHRMASNRGDHCRTRERDRICCHVVSQFKRRDTLCAHAHVYRWRVS